MTLLDHILFRSQAEHWHPKDEDFKRIVDAFFAFYTNRKGILSEVEKRAISLPGHKVQALGQTISWQEKGRIATITFAWVIPKEDKPSLFFIFTGDNPKAPDKKSYRQYRMLPIQSKKDLDQLEKEIRSLLDTAQARNPVLFRPWGEIDEK